MRSDGDRTGNGDALLLAARQLVGPPVQEVGIHRDHVEQLAQSSVGRLVPTETERDVLADREMREQAAVLRDVADAPLECAGPTRGHSRRSGRCGSCRRRAVRTPRSGAGRWSCHSRTDRRSRPFARPRRRGRATRGPGPGRMPSRSPRGRSQPCVIEPCDAPEEHADHRNRQQHHQERIGCRAGEVQVVDVAPELRRRGCASRWGRAAAWRSAR